ncbi:MAG: hypothetical protein NTZ90_13755 [Proteobacteria bacterium]|nr:hypothetical protein [Pseudomonadota bacterium]
MQCMPKLIVLSGLLTIASACGTRPESVSRLQASGWYGLDRLQQATVDAINQACADPRGAADTGVSFDECRLIIAGSAVRESSWDVNKSCEDWGNPSDPACGLTQSRWADAHAVGLDCSPSEHSPAGYKCNALTGLRNLRCKADGGTSCDRWGGGRSLHIGIKKHLGSNQGVFDSYQFDMETIYNRQDVWQKFGSSGERRQWQQILYTPQ